MVLKLNKRPKRSNFRDRSCNHVTYTEATINVCPWIICKLLNAERNTLVRSIDIQYDCIDFVALL